MIGQKESQSVEQFKESLSQADELEESYVPQEWASTSTCTMLSQWLLVSQGQHGLGTNMVVAKSDKGQGYQPTMLSAVGDLSDTFLWPLQVAFQEQALHLSLVLTSQGKD